MVQTESILVVVRQIENLKGKYAKQALMNLERTNEINPRIRKIILDAFNDYARSLSKNIAGYVLEE